MGPRKSRVLDAISSRMDILESRIVEPAGQEVQAGSLAQSLSKFRFALRMAKSQFDVLEQQVLTTRNTSAQVKMLRKQQIIERSISSQFNTSIVGKLERWQDDRCAASRPVPSITSGD